MLKKYISKGDQDQRGCHRRQVRRGVPFVLALIAGAWGCGFVSNAQAALVGTAGPTQILSLNSYSEYGGGDVIFVLATSVSGCEAGFWLRPTDPGFERNYAILMSAKLAGRAVSVNGHDNEIWGGSISKFCRLYDIGLH